MSTTAIANLSIMDITALRNAIVALLLDIKVSNRPCVAARAVMRRHIREYYLRKCAGSRKRGLIVDKEYRRKRRMKPEIASIEREFRSRLTAPRRAVAASRHDKRLEQLRGREIQVVKAWKARQLARLDYGPAASNEKVAHTYRTLIRGAVKYSPDQASNDHRLIQELERAECVWDKFRRAAS
jgi:hypothetical protein